ncbi:MAG TPA: N-acetyl-gamma-glutamyl-phosphate reductase [Acidimicrobiales bacterium]|jgi:N-acetyl-gamma-glutamyl-phosphate reductase
MATIGIIGGSGFTGAELLRLCASHPQLQVAWATGDRHAGTAIADVYPSLATTVGDATYEKFDVAMVAGCDLVFIGLPHGASQMIVPELLDASVPHLVDLGADFRLQDISLYPEWYGEPHRCPNLLPRFAYGLPELFRDRIVAADHVAVPGCYPTTASLVVAPLVRAGMIDPTGVVVDAYSGVSGAGSTPQIHTTFNAVDEDLSAYGLLGHRHTPEIEVNCGATVLFTPHLAPINRGILVTATARGARTGLTTDDVLDALHDAYDAEAFVHVTADPPHTKSTLGSNTCHLTARVDPRTGIVLMLSALDNLTKGASGGAVQCANLLLGLPETTGLPIAGLYP